MNIARIHGLLVNGRTALAAVVLLAAAAPLTFSQEDKNEHKGRTASPARSAPARSHSEGESPRHSAPEGQRSAPPQSRQAAPPSQPPGDAPGRTYGRRNSGAPSDAGSPGYRAPANAGPPNPRPAIATPNAAETPGNRAPAGNPAGDNPGRRPGSYPPGSNGGARNVGGSAPGGNAGRPGGYTPGSNPANRNTVLTPPPAGRVFGANGRTGPTVIRTSSGGTVRRSYDGRVREVHTPSGAVIRHEPFGVRRVEVVRPGGRVIVATGRTGYVQRPVIVSGREFVQRTYVIRGRPEVRVYRPVHYGAIVVNVYRPIRYYPAPLYVWAYSPWYQPVHYSWGWGGRPWYGYYGGWFEPYPVYASPALWLTDYLFAATLEAAYQARMDAAIADANAAAYARNTTPLTPDVKQAVSDEVRRQLDEARAEQANPNNYQPDLFGGGNDHVFVVANALDVISSAGECTITEGDVLQLNGLPPQNAVSANVVVLASKGADCRKGSTVTVGIADLQEMQNHMRATLDQGLADLRSKQGQGGIPAAPPAATAPPVDAPYAAQIHPDADAVREIPQAAQEAERAEQDVVNQSVSAADGAAPVTIALGQTTADVVAMLGQPPKTADLGARQIYIYKDMKITFTDGRVTDVQ